MSKQKLSRRDLLKMLAACAGDDFCLAIGHARTRTGLSISKTHKGK